MGKDTTKKIVVGTVIGLAAGYVAGILTAPKSGKETRADIKDAGTKALRATEQRLKELYGDLGDVIEQASGAAKRLSGRGKQKMADLIEDAKDARYKVKEVLSAIRSGDADDPDLQNAVNRASEAKKHLANYLKKSI